jgi:hypothetical protein
MWRLSKELNGAKPLNEGGYRWYGEIMDVNLPHVKQIRWQGLLRSGRT